MLSVVESLLFDAVLSLELVLEVRGRRQAVEHVDVIALEQRLLVADVLLQAHRRRLLHRQLRHAGHHPPAQPLQPRLYRIHLHQSQPATCQHTCTNDNITATVVDVDVDTTHLHQLQPHLNSPARMTTSQPRVNSPAPITASHVSAVPITSVHQRSDTQHWTAEKAMGATTAEKLAETQVVDVNYRSPSISSFILSPSTLIDPPLQFLPFPFLLLFHLPLNVSLWEAL